jgi:hypothetical protein
LNEVVFKTQRTLITKAQLRAANKGEKLAKGSFNEFLHFDTSFGKFRRNKRFDYLRKRVRFSKALKSAHFITYATTLEFFYSQFNNEKDEEAHKLAIAVGSTAKWVRESFTQCTRVTPEGETKKGRGRRQVLEPIGTSDPVQQHVEESVPEIAAESSGRVTRRQSKKQK